MNAARGMETAREPKSNRRLELCSCNAASCIVLQCVAVRCSALQCVAVCDGVWQCAITFAV